MSIFGGGGGGSQKTSSTGGTSTTSAQLPQWLEGYARDFMSLYQGAAQKWVSANDPNDPSAGHYEVKDRPAGLDQQQAPFTPEQYQAISMLGNLTNPAQNLANTGAYENALSLSGAYYTPNSNPYINAVYNAAARPVTDSYRTATAPGIIAAAQRYGQGGGSAMNEALSESEKNLGDTLNNLSANIYGGNYQQERSRTMQALGYAPQTLQNLYAPATSLYGAGALQQQQNQSENDTAYSNAVGKDEYKFDILSGLGGALGQAGGGSGTSVTSTTPSVTRTQSGK